MAGSDRGTYTEVGIADAGLKAGLQRRQSKLLSQRGASTSTTPTGPSNGLGVDYETELHTNDTRNHPSKQSKPVNTSKNIRRRMNEMWSQLYQSLAMPHRDPGVLLPTGLCKRIHVDNKRIKLIVDHRFYFHDRICTDPDCQTTENVTFFKKINQEKCFSLNGRVSESFEKEFGEIFSEYVNDFARTVKPSKKDKAVQPFGFEQLPNPQYKKYDSWCHHCDRFIDLLEFGEVTVLDKLTKEEFNNVISCYHGGQAVGHHLSFYMHYLIQFYIGTKLLLHNHIEECPPLDDMFYSSCDGQTFLPYHRQFLHLYKESVKVREALCKVAFQSIYLYVYMRKKFDPTYSFQEDFFGCGLLYLHCFSHKF